MSSTPGSTNNNSNNAPGGGGGWITGIYTVFFNCPLQTVMGLQVWRLFTSFLMEGSVLGLLFSVLMFYPLAKQMEASMTSTAFLALLARIHILTQIGFIFLMMFIAFNPIAPIYSFLARCSMGMWPIVLALMGIDAARRPDEIKRMLFFPCPIQNRYFPWIFIALFSVLGGIQYHLIVGTIIGYMYGWDWLQSLDPSQERLRRWEETTLASVVNQPYYVSISYGGGPRLDGGRAAQGGSVRPGDSERDNGNATSFMFGGGSGASSGYSSSNVQQQQPFPGKGKALCSSGSASSELTLSESGRNQDARTAASRREELRRAAEARFQNKNRNKSPDSSESNNQQEQQHQSSLQQDQLDDVDLLNP